MGKKKGAGRTTDYTSFATSDEALRVAGRMAVDRGNNPSGLTPSAASTAGPHPTHRPFHNIVRAIETPSPRARQTLLTTVGAAALGRTFDSRGNIRLWPSDKLYIPLLSQPVMRAIVRTAVEGQASVTDLLQRIIYVAGPKTSRTIDATVRSGLKVGREKNPPYTIHLSLESRAAANDTELLTQAASMEIQRNVDSSSTSSRYNLTIGVSDRHLLSVRQGLAEICLPEWAPNTTATLGGLQVADLNEIYEYGPLPRPNS